MWSISGLILILIISDSYSQRAFHCVIPSLCSDSVSINPRIVSPTSVTAPVTVAPSSCPTGYVSCTNVRCGVSTVQPDATDGFATRGAFPWHAFLQNANNIAVKNGYAGGGVLVGQYFVLTAAHKVTNLTNINVILGVYNSGDLTNTQTSAVSSVYVHSQYDPTTLKNDVALLLLATPINYSGSINAICLPAAGRSYQNTGTGCVVSGFGQTNFAIDDAPTVSMKQVHVPIVDSQVCRTSFSGPTMLGTNTDIYLDVQNEICAGGQSGRDACTQDGGSPLVCFDATARTSSLAGLVIWGKNCGMPNVYGVYVNVPSYISWIQCTQLCMRGRTSCTTCPARPK